MLGGGLAGGLAGDGWVAIGVVTRVTVGARVSAKALALLPGLCHLCHSESKHRVH